jgi:hypothetical protein
VLLLLLSLLSLLLLLEFISVCTAREEASYSSLGSRMRNRISDQKRASWELRACVVG